MRNSFRRTWISALIALTFFAAWPASASQKDKAKKGSHDAQVAAQVSVEVFRDRDREIIRNYYAVGRKGLPPGLAKKEGGLPPGLEKQLRRNGHLPPGLEKRVTAFPVELERQLPPLKPGLKRGVIEGHAVIFGEHTSAILDVLVVF